MATTWTTTSSDDLVKHAGLIAVCEVVRYPCEQLRKDEIVMPGYIKLRVVETLRGTEPDKDLLVEWIDFARDASIKEGMPCVVFLHRGEPGRKIDYWGVPTNATYQRFNPGLGLREINNGGIKWTKNRPLTIAQLTKLVNAKVKPAAAAPGK